MSDNGVFSQCTGDSRVYSDVARMGSPINIAKSGGRTLKTVMFIKSNLVYYIKPYALYEITGNDNSKPTLTRIICIVL